MEHVAKRKEFIYAGFRYYIDDNGEPTPVPGQHPAASKDKHIRTVREIFNKYGWDGSEE